MKVLVISRSFPPYVSGSSTILGNLFRCFQQDTYVVLSEKREPVDLASRLGCMIFSCNLKLRGVYLGGNSVNGYIQYLLIPFLTLKALRIIKRQKIDRIFSVYPTAAFFISSFLAHRITKRPLFTYMHDTWEEALVLAPFNTVAHRNIARVFEKLIFRSSSKVFTVSSALQNLYSRKHGIQAVTLPHSMDLSINLSGKYQDCKETRKFHTIAFTGSVYSVNYDPIKMLADVVNSMPDGEVKLTICAPEADMLKEWGIDGKNIESRFASRSDALSLQRQADILFIPLAFEPSSIELKTAFPTKTLEYLISGTPILVCAPANYYISKCAREEGWGLVVDSLTPQALQEGILRLLRDDELRQRLVQNARRVALSHDANVISGKLQEYLSM